MEAHRKSFRDTVARMFTLLGRAEAEKEAQMVFDLQKSIAQIQVPAAET